MRLRRRLPSRSVGGSLSTNLCECKDVLYLFVIYMPSLTFLWNHVYQLLINKEKEIRFVDRFELPPNH